MSDCSVCGKVAEPAYSIIHSECGCSTHTDCLGDEIDYNTCPAHLGEVVTPIVSGEPHTDDGVDYVKHPGTKQQPGVLSKVSSLIRRTPAVQPDTVESLLKKHVPVDVIMKKHKYGLDHALKEGITIDDFLVNGYELKHLALYEYVSKRGPERALNTLVDGLQLNANHLRDHPHELPFREFKKLTGLENSQICTKLGLHFPEDDSLQCYNDLDWNAKHCVALGLKYEDLIDFGLQYIQQYEDLMKGLSQSEMTKMEVALGATVEQVSMLVDLTPAPIPVPPREELSSEERSRSPSPAPRRRVKEKPIVHIPPSYRAEKKKLQAPPPRKNPYSRHGFIDTKKK